MTLGFLGCTKERLYNLLCKQIQRFLKAQSLSRVLLNALCVRKWCAFSWCYLATTPFIKQTIKLEILVKDRNLKIEHYLTYHDIVIVTISKNNTLRAILFTFIAHLLKNVKYTSKSFFLPRLTYTLLTLQRKVM